MIAQHDPPRPQAGAERSSAENRKMMVDRHSTAELSVLFCSQRWIRSPMQAPALGGQPELDSCGRLVIERS
jgi:hypothetical protein